MDPDPGLTEVLDVVGELVAHVDAVQAGAGAGARATTQARSRPRASVGCTIAARTITASSVGVKQALMALWPTGESLAGPPGRG